MRKFIYLGIISITYLLLFQGCSATSSSAEKEQIAAEILNAVNSSDFTFKATYVNPSRFSPRHLSPYYQVVVMPDTVKVHLPYFGKAYRAPVNPSDAGFNFTSLDFDYSVEKGKKQGSWYVEIIIKDLDRRVTLNFDIWENETSRLSITDTDRQGISFQGNIVTKDSE